MSTQFIPVDTVMYCVLSTDTDVDIDHESTLVDRAHKWDLGKGYQIAVKPGAAVPLLFWMRRVAEVEPTTHVILDYKEFHHSRVRHLVARICVQEDMEAGVELTLTKHTVQHLGVPRPQEFEPACGEDRIREICAEIRSRHSDRDGAGSLPR